MGEREDVKFLNLCDFYPDGILYSENYVIFKKEILQEEIDDIKLDNSTVGFHYADKFISGEKHVLLANKDGFVMMSTHQSETITNQGFINNASGDVLVFGLGIGLIIFPLLELDYITSITIIEIDSDLIKLVGGEISKYDKFNKVKIIEGDAFDYHLKLDKNVKFDTIYFDIWAKITKQSIVEMEMLHNNFRVFKRKEDSYLTSWCYDIKEILII